MESEAGLALSEKSSTFSVRADEVLATNPACGAYVTIIECVPAASELVFNAAWPEPSNAMVPSAVGPSLKVTVPAGTVKLAGTVATVAVKVTAPPAKTGFASAESVVPVASGGGGTVRKRYALIEPMRGLLPHCSEFPIVEVAS